MRKLLDIVGQFLNEFLCMIPFLILVLLTMVECVCIRLVAD